MCALSSPGCPVRDPSDCLNETNYRAMSFHIVNQVTCQIACEAVRDASATAVLEQPKYEGDNVVPMPDLSSFTQSDNAVVVFAILNFDREKYACE